MVIVLKPVTQFAAHYQEHQVLFLMFNLLTIKLLQCILSYNNLQ